MTLPVPIPQGATRSVWRERKRPCSSILSVGPSLLTHPIRVSRPAKLACAGYPPNRSSAIPSPSVTGEAGWGCRFFPNLDREGRRMCSAHSLSKSEFAYHTRREFRLQRSTRALDDKRTEPMPTAISRRAAELAERNREAEGSSPVQQGATSLARPMHVSCTANSPARDDVRPNP